MLARQASRSGDLAPVEDVLSFEDLGLPDPIQRGLADAGFKHPSPIQVRAIPLGRFGVDMIAQAKSGTGKTVVFAVVALEMVIPNDPGAQALIIAPTREIALQSRDVCRTLGAYVKGVRTNAFVGGTSMRNDISLAAKSQVACGTPGRLVGLLLCEALVADRVRLLVLDEADKLCHDDGFEEQLRYLLTSLPERKQTLAFSATYPAPLLKTLQASMRSPITVSLLRQPSEDLKDAASSILPPLPAGVDDDGDDPLALLERAAAFGQPGNGPTGGAAAADAGSTPHLVGGAALLAVHQFYRLVYPTEADGREGGGVRGGGRDGEGHDGQSKATTLSDHLADEDGGGARGGGGGGGSLAGEGDRCNASISVGEQQRRPLPLASSAKQREVVFLLSTLRFYQALVFCNDPGAAKAMTARLQEAGFPAAFISGSHSQSERTSIMREHMPAAMHIHMHVHHT